MDRLRIERALRNLDELDFDNLVAGRFTKDTINEAMRRLRKELADELNDMLRAARIAHEKGWTWKKDPCPRCGGGGVVESGGAHVLCPGCA